MSMLSHLKSFFRRQPSPPPKCLFQSRLIRVVDASQLDQKIKGEAGKLLHQTLEVYRDWSQLGRYQKMEGVDILLVRSDAVLKRIAFRAKVEKKSEEIKRVVDILAPFLSEFDYINILG